MIIANTFAVSDMESDSLSINDSLRDKETCSESEDAIKSKTEQIPATSTPVKRLGAEISMSEGDETLHCLRTKKIRAKK